MSSTSNHALRFFALLALLALACLATCGRGEPPAPAAPSEVWPVALETGADLAQAEPEYERVVLVTIDTLRADHLSSHGYPRATTPFLDSLAARGVRFERAMAAISHTAPSHATMLTGLVPAVHGVARNGESLSADALDAASLLGAAGFESAAFLNAKFLGAVAGSFGTVAVRGAGGKHPKSGADVVDAAIAWLQGGLPEGKRQGPRFFLWVHLYDPHEWQVRMHRAGEDAPAWSGTSPEDFTERVLALHGLPPIVPGQPYVIDWGTDRPSSTRIQDESLATFLRGIEHYDELVRFADAQVERLYAAIEGGAEGMVEGRGLPGRTLWIVTSDHGEGLGSHATTGHGTQLYQEQLHVPLILHASDGSLGPRVVPALVGHIDLLPTLAETLGRRLRGDPRLYEGRSLWPLVRGEPAADFGPRPIFGQRRPPEDPAAAEATELFSLQDGRLKLILRLPGGEEIFDLHQDPKELSALELETSELAELRAGLGERLRAYRSLGGGEAQPLSEDILRELEQLGYGGEGYDGE